MRPRFASFLEAKTSGRRTDARERDVITNLLADHVRERLGGLCGAVVMDRVMRRPTAAWAAIWIVFVGMDLALAGCRTTRVGREVSPAWHRPDTPRDTQSEASMPAEVSSSESAGPGEGVVDGEPGRMAKEDQRRAASAMDRPPPPKRRNSVLRPPIRR